MGMIDLWDAGPESPLDTFRRDLAAAAHAARSGQASCRLWRRRAPGLSAGRFHRLPRGRAGLERRLSGGRIVPLGPGHRAFLLKPWDVATYVELGVAHLGVCGSDVLVERQPDVYELVDLGIGAAARSSAPQLHRVISRHADVGMEAFEDAIRQVDRELRKPLYAEGVELSTEQRFANSCIDVLDGLQHTLAKVP